MVIFWTFLLVVIMIYGQYLIFNKFSLKHVQYNRKFKQQTIFEEEQCHLEEQVENRKKLWIPSLYVESLLDVHLTFGKQDNLFVSTGSIYQNHASFFVLRGYSRITRTHNLVATKRGVYRLSSVTLSAGDLFGFSKKVETRQLHEQSPLIVYPKPELPKYNAQNDDFSFGEYSVKRFIMPDPFMVIGTRQFVPGDAIKAINWHASARTNELQVNYYDYTSNKKLMILINCEDHESMWKTVTDSDSVEQYIRYAAGISQLAIEQGLEVGISSNMSTLNQIEPTVIEPQGGQPHWFTLLDYLAHLKIERQLPFHEYVERFVHYYSEPTVFIIFSSYWNEQLEYNANLLRYKQHQVHHIQIENPDLNTAMKREA